MSETVSNIVALSPLRSRKMRLAPIAQVRAYWEALRNGRDVPLRSEVDPRGIERALEHAFVLERIAPGVTRFRLAGTHLNDLMGMEVRGMPLTTFFAPSARDEVAARCERVFAGPEIVELALSAETSLGKPPMAARMILLPLRSDLGDISRAIGCLVAEGQIGRAPRRFVIAAAESAPVSKGRLIERPVPAPRINGMAEPPAHFAAARGHLRLVKSDE